MADDKVLYGKTPTFAVGGKSVKQEAADAQDLQGQGFFRGLVARKEVQFPKALGEQHPYDFSITDDICDSFGFVNAIINKTVEYIWGSGVHLESDNKQALKVMEEWCEEVHFFDEQGPEWTRQGLKNGGWLELGGNDQEIKGMKILDAKTMYVKRDDKGNVTAYNQLIKGITQDRDFNKNPLKQNEDFIAFKPRQIAYLAFNKNPTRPYGLGVIYPNLQAIDDYLGGNKAMHMLLRRKAGTPYWVKMGSMDKDIYPTPDAVTSMANNLVYLQEKTEWVTGPDVDIKPLDFGDIAGKFTFALEHDLQMMFYGFQTPKSVAGGAVPAGLGSSVGDAQGDDYDKHIEALQQKIELEASSKIFKRVLNAKGIDARVDIVWGEQSEAEKKAKIDMLKNLLMSVSNRGLRGAIEIDLANTLGYGEEVLTDDSEEDPDADDDNDDEDGEDDKDGKDKKKPNPFFQFFKKKDEVKSKEKKVKHMKSGCVIAYGEDLETDHRLMEWIGFNYHKYTKDLQKIIKKDAFSDLLATNEAELAAGYLSVKGVGRLRNAIGETFEKGLSVKTLASNLFTSRIIPDLYNVSEDGSKTLIMNSAMRSMTVARTETIRIANEAAISNFKAGGVEKVKYVAALTDRTCEDCLSLDGQVYEINDIPGLATVPIHPNCRCTYAPVVFG